MEITEELKKLLTNPFEGLEANNASDFKDECAKIARELFNNHCILCGEKKYYFAEIEFYYYDKDRWNKKWNEKTYPRDNKYTGDFFFHYSGVDICFKSKFDEGKFGGILIRSLKDEGHFITGPSVCMLEILNTCFEQKTIPELKKIKKEECKLSKNPAARYGITYKSDNITCKEKDIKDIPSLCFYDQALFDKYTGEKNKETFKNATWDYSWKRKKDINRYYHRFDDKNENNK